MIKNYIFLFLVLIMSISFVSADEPDPGLFNQLYEIIGGLDIPATDFIVNISKKIYEPYEPTVEHIAPQLDSNDNANSIYSEKFDKMLASYLKEQEKQKEQSLRGEQILEQKKQVLFGKLNEVFDLFLYVFILFKELLFITFYVFEMYLILLLFLKVIPFMLNWVVEGLSGAYIKIKGDKN